MNTTYLLYVVPETQPDHSDQSIIYGGYHITLFPEQNIPENFDLTEMMKSFPMTKDRWKLPDDSILLSPPKRVSRKGLYMIGLESNTLNELMNHFQSPSGPFDPQTRWEPVHLTLGSSGINPNELYKVFMSETKWFVQLVKRIPITDKPGRNPKNYSWTWLPDQRVPLYRAS